MASHQDIQHNSLTLKINGFDDVPRPFLIGVGGGTASGKSSVCSKIMEQLGQNRVEVKQVQIISLESFYKQLSDQEQVKVKRGLYNFDHPDAFDDKLMLNTLRKLKEGKPVEIPKYDFIHHRRLPEENWLTVQPVDVILFEGILVFYFKEVREFFNLKLFVDTDADTRLSRRVMRDVKEMGRDLDKTLQQYTTFVKPAFEEFCLPTKKYVDVIIPRGADNSVAIDLIVQHIQDLLKGGKTGVRRIRHNSDSLVSRPH